MSQNVVMLLGVNGVGKSTIANMLAEEMPGSVTLSGSNILMKAFGGITREELERLSLAEKILIMEPAFLAAINDHASAEIIILDTHLVVPIRKNGDLVLENIWSDKYSPYIKAVYFITGTPEEIRERRAHDYQITGRVRDLDEDNIDLDQQINLAAFEDIIAKNLLYMLVHNPKGDTGSAVRSIINNLESSELV